MADSSPSAPAPREPLPCPCCGADGALRSWRPQTYVVECTNLSTCTLRTDEFWTKSAAIEAWNRRAPLDPPRPPSVTKEMEGFRSHVIRVFGDVMGELRIFRDSNKGTMFEQCADWMRSMAQAMTCPRCKKRLRGVLAWDAGDGATQRELREVCDVCLGDPTYYAAASRRALPVGEEMEPIVRRIVAGLGDSVLKHWSCYKQPCGHPRAEHEEVVVATMCAALGFDAARAVPPAETSNG